ncbi:1-acyl-sn-glycerol-3-phosphate acyltransferase [Sansalvadorimonas sp. 2012CJ34-2]|uniref:1-acyl-sn-glycerol-3-phosphate acyltransferase n=1 Tax=Parendozoicomonas callyspongiae TaxID=2942213 RepID=A0ABT0PCS3_9GAMM|nr:lysophospholipid acyltransferase family protein [Sansalvadorimonas sp. 2012CJ34-2]MCL6268552.1 1-acyl-sn-glycerol-3-phosphate acyltransferase [Sansalvadorimonas sp. 2012CJ34-2]
MKELLLWPRTILFYIVITLWTILWSILIITTVPFIPKHKCHPFFVRNWAIVSINLCRYICGITWRVEGVDNIPDKPCIIASNHQSPWETFFLQVLFSPQSTVIKEELLSIPFFGWAFKRLSPIPINRKDSRSAIQQVIEKGTDSLNENYWVLIFPEGTRHRWPKLGRINRGTAALARHSEACVLPLAHNAGRYWPADKWLKRPGEITVRIGPAISSTDKSTLELTNEIKDWLGTYLPH